MEKIGKYEIIEMLGKGGMGVVYKARDPVIQRIVAIKTVSAELNSDPEMRARFLREARSAGQLSHKNIITIYDLGEENGRAYIAMEYLEGDDLNAMIARREPMNLEDKIRIMIEVCEALAHAHDRRVIHRDIKPGNIFLTPSGQVKILDFGLARVEFSDITRIGLTLGTPNYMSPEQVKGDRAGCQSDIFSAGTVFYELLTFRKPFEGNSYASIISKILHDEPASMQLTDSRIPHELSDIMRKALSKDLQLRYQSAREMALDLGNLLQSMTAGMAGAEGSSSEVSADGQQTEGDSARPGVSSRSAETEALAFPSPSLNAQVVPVPPELPRRDRRFAYLSVAAVALVGLAATLMFVLFRSLSGTSTQVPIPATSPEKAAPGTDLARARAPAEASRLLENGRYSEAAKQAQSILEHSPDNPEAQNLLAAARAALEKIAKGNLQAKALYAAGRYEEAKTALDSVLKIAPSDPEARRLSIQLDQYTRKGGGQAAIRSKQAETRAEAVDAAELVRKSLDAAKEIEAASKAGPAAKQSGRSETETGPQAAQKQQANRQAVLGLLQRYKSAYENKDLSSLRALWPSLGGSQETAIQEEFQNARSINIDLQGIEILFAEDQALVISRRNIQLVTADGRKLQTESRATFSLRLMETNWSIETIRFEALR